MRHSAAFLVPVVGLALLLAGCPGDDETNTTTNILPLKITIQTQYLPDGSVGQAYSAQIIASGGTGKFIWTVEPGGTNDGWLTIDDQGTLSGTPQAANAGDVVLLVKAAEESNATNFDIEIYYLNVDMTATGFGISTLTLPNAWSGTYYSQYLQAYGGSGNYGWVKLVGGINDAWITVNATSGRVSGTPQASAVGPVTLNVKMFDRDDADASVSMTYTFNVYEGWISILNEDPLPNAAAGQSYSVQMRVEGGSGSYIWAKEAGGVNSAWLSIDAQGLLTGTAPTALGIVEVNVSVLDAQNPNLFTQDTYHFQIKLLAISTERLDPAFVGLNYSEALATQGGGGSISFNIEPGGSNYVWTQINGSNIESISPPTTNELGPVAVIIRATDGTNSDARIFDFQVYDAVQVAPSVPDGYVGVGYSQPVSVSGGSGNFVFSIQTGGSNDTWLSIDASTGRLYGSPTSANMGAVQVVVRAEDVTDSAAFDQRTVNFNILGLIITTTSIPGASVGSAYSTQIRSIGGSGYTAWSITSGPAWLSIDPNNGTLSGTPSAAGISQVTVYVYDPLDPLLNDTAVYTLMAVNTLLIENFDSGAMGWSFSSYWYRQVRDPNGSYNNYTGPRAAHSGTYLAQTGSSGFPYSNCIWNSSYYMLSPSIAVPATGNCYLTFWVWYEFETGYMGTNDGGQLQYDLNGNNVWTPLVPSTPAGYNGTAGGQPAFTGFGVSDYNDGWSQVIADLSPMAGNTVRIRWYLYTDGDMMVFRGWTVDDVHVFDLGTGSNQPLPAVEPTPGDGWTYGVSQASDLTNGVDLTWRGGLGATSFDVYLGTTSTAVAGATTGSTEFMGNQTGDVYAATNLTAGTTYYWRVDCVNANGTTAGPVWSFTPVNPVKILIGELNNRYYAYYGRLLELLNPSPTVHQNLRGWMINTYGTYTTGYPYLTNYALPSGIVLHPDTARTFCDYQCYYHNGSPYRCWNFVHTPVYYNCYYGTYHFEAWLQMPGGAGVDYMGVNVGGSNRPSDLNWIGTLNSTSSSYSLWARKNNVDTDNASDYRGAYTYSGYGSSYGIYPSMKDSGQ